MKVMIMVMVLPRVMEEVTWSWTMVALGMHGVPPPPMMFLICCWLHCPAGAEGEVSGTMAITNIPTTLAILSTASNASHCHADSGG